MSQVTTLRSEDQFHPDTLNQLEPSSVETEKRLRNAHNSVDAFNDEDES